MKVLSIIFASTVLFGIVTFAWDADSRCHDLGKYRELEESWEDELQEEVAVAVVPTKGTDLKPLAKDNNPKNNLRGQDKRNLAQKITTFQVKLHWEQEYCWQAEWYERKWCMSCHGGTCSEGDTLWIQECNKDSLIQRFVWEEVDTDRSRTGKLKPYTRQDLCLENIGRQGESVDHFGDNSKRWWWFVLRKCDPNKNSTTEKSQILSGYDTNDPFKLAVFDDTVLNGPKRRVISMQHHPRAGESVIGEYSARACNLDDTCLWDVYKRRSDPLVPDIDTSKCCPPWQLMKTKEKIEAGDTIVNWEADTYVQQYRNGRFVVRRGYPKKPGKVLFDSKVDRSEGDYVSKMQDDGTFVTRDEDGDSVWSIHAGDATSQYFLAVECDLETVSIYEYVVEDPGGVMWTSNEDYHKSARCEKDSVKSAGLSPTASPTSSTPSPTSYLIEISGSGGDCTVENKCGRCQGDCDKDNQCAGELVCHKDYKRLEDGTYPGCSGTTTTFNDYCVHPRDIPPTPNP